MLYATIFYFVACFFVLPVIEHQMGKDHPATYLPLLILCFPFVVFFILFCLSLITIYRFLLPARPPKK
jgi:uncharacterized BrkB/YihY/UPF0761 family membrane protein